MLCARLLKVSRPCKSPDAAPMALLFWLRWEYTYCAPNCSVCLPIALPTSSRTRVSGIGVAPRHVGRIDGKTSAAISGIGAEKIDSRHLAAKAVVKDVTDGTLRKKQSQDQR